MPEPLTVNKKNRKLAGKIPVRVYCRGTLAILYLWQERHLQCRPSWQRHTEPLPFRQLGKYQCFALSLGQSQFIARRHPDSAKRSGGPCRLYSSRVNRQGTAYAIGTLMRPYRVPRAARRAFDRGGRFQRLAGSGGTLFS